MRLPVARLTERARLERADNSYYHDGEKVRTRTGKQHCPILDPHSHISAETHEAQFANLRYKGEFYPAFTFVLAITPDDHRRQMTAPVRLSMRIWGYRDHAYFVENDFNSDEDIAIAIRHQVMREDRRYAKMRREIEAFEQLDTLASKSDREKIRRPSVSLFGNATAAGASAVVVAKSWSSTT